MLLQLENTSEDNLKKLFDFASRLNLNLSLIDQDDSNGILPGKPLSEDRLKAMIATSRKSGVISMETAHDIIRKGFNGN